MNPRAVLFDLGQTLLEYPASTTEEWGRFLRARLRDMYPLFVQRIAGLSDANAFSRTAMDIMWPDHRINMKGRSWHFHDRLRAVFSHYRSDCPREGLDELIDVFYRPIGAGTQRYPETRDVLRELRAAQLPLAIISNAPWDIPGRLLVDDMRRWRIDGYFDAMIMSGDVPWRKPNPEFMYAASRELGVDPHECLVVGDSLRADIAGAKAAGIRSVWINREGAPRPEDAAQPDWEIGTLSGVLEITGLG